MIRAAAAAAVLAAGVGSVGCVGPSAGTARGEGHGPIGDGWRNAVDPCYPERYSHAAREAVVAPFAQQVHNGYVMNQTIYNWYFDYASDTLTPAALVKLDSLARARPAPDPKIILQTARDLPANTDLTRMADVRADLDARRIVAIQKYMASQPSFAPVAYEVLVSDPATPSISAEMSLRAYNGSFQSIKGSVSGAGTGVLGTGGGGGALTSTPSGSSSAPGAGGNGATSGAGAGGAGTAPRP
jgi:hypothetical protein